MIASVSAQTIAVACGRGGGGMTHLLLVAAALVTVFAAAGVGEGAAWAVGGDEMAASLRVNRIVTV